MRKPCPVKTCTICGVKRKIKNHHKVNKYMCDLRITANAFIFIYKDVKYFTIYCSLQGIICSLAPMDGIARLCHSCQTIYENLISKNIFGELLEIKLEKMLTKLGYKRLEELYGWQNIDERGELLDDGEISMSYILTKEEESILKIIVADKILKNTIRNKKKEMR